MKGKKTISRVDRNTRDNLVNFADNLPFSYYRAPQKQQRFDEKWVKSATDWKFIIQNTPTCWNSRPIKNNLKLLLAKRDNFSNFEIFRKVFGSFYELAHLKPLSPRAIFGFDLIKASLPSLVGTLWLVGIAGTTLKGVVSGYKTHLDVPCCSWLTPYPWSGNINSICTLVTVSKFHLHFNISANFRQRS